MRRVMSRRMKQIAGVFAGLMMFAIGAASREPLVVLAFAPLGGVVLVFSLKSIADDRKKPPKDSDGS